MAIFDEGEIFGYGECAKSRVFIGLEMPEKYRKLNWSQLHAYYPLLYNKLLY